MNTIHSTTTELVDSVCKTAESLSLRYDLYAILSPDDSIHSYGLRVTVKNRDEEEYAYAPDIARTRKEAQRIFRTLADGLVTPCTFFEILDELL